jgi:hypothetical protein
MEEYIELRRKSNYKDLATQWFLTEKSLSDVGKSTDMYSMKSLDIKLGSFYFIELSDQNKSTRIEKLSIAFPVEYKPKISEYVFQAINFNFLPSNVRELMFLNLIEGYQKNLDINKERKITEEIPVVPDTSYQNMIQFLTRYGLEYTTSIRYYDLRLIKRIHYISSNNLAKLIMTDMKPISGMDDVGILKVLSGKIQNEGVEGYQNNIYNIKSNYESIIEELKDKFKNMLKEIDKLS